jgi:hypothetical protein
VANMYAVYEATFAALTISRSRRVSFAPPANRPTTPRPPPPVPRPPSPDRHTRRLGLRRIQLTADAI